MTSCNVSHTVAMFDPSMNRSSSVDFPDEQAARLLSEHVKMADATKQKMFTYRKQTHGCRPGWSDIWVLRHFYTDLIVMTGGKLLRQRQWEQQLAKFLSDHGQPMNSDAVSLTGSLPRMVLSHLWAFKRDGAKSGCKVPKKYQQLQALVDAMCVPVERSKVEVAMSDAESDLSSCSSDVLVDESRPKKQIPVVVVSDCEPPIAHGRVRLRSVVCFVLRL